MRVLYILLTVNKIYLKIGVCQRTRVGAILSVTIIGTKGCSSRGIRRSILGALKARSGCTRIDITRGLVASRAKRSFSCCTEVTCIARVRDTAISVLVVPGRLCRRRGSDKVCTSLERAFKSRIFRSLNTISSRRLRLSNDDDITRRFKLECSPIYVYLPNGIGGGSGTLG